MPTRDDDRDDRRRPDGSGRLLLWLAGGGVLLFLLLAGVGAFVTVNARRAARREDEMMRAEMLARDEENARLARKVDDQAAARNDRLEVLVSNARLVPLSGRDGADAVGVAADLTNLGDRPLRSVCVEVRVYDRAGVEVPAARVDAWCLWTAAEGEPGLRPGEGRTIAGDRAYRFPDELAGRLDGGSVSVTVVGTAREDPADAP